LESLHFKEKYPLFRMERQKAQMRFNNVDEIIAYLKEEIANHPVATYIGVFDHYAHTKSLPEGEIAEDILEAKNVLFCFVVSFMEAPNPAANESMKAWIGALEI
jgi:hypothetical protein